MTAACHYGAAATIPRNPGPRTGTARALLHAFWFGRALFRRTR